MKKVLYIIIILIASKNTQAQSNILLDTLAYLQQIVANKNFFIGKPFSVLKDSLKLEIKHFSPLPGIHYDFSKETSTSFAFYFPQSPNEVYLTYPKLNISWQPFLNRNQSMLLHNQNKGKINVDVFTFYANAIIRNIEILE